jgi:hypothetical protein
MKLILYPWQFFAASLCVFSCWLTEPCAGQSKEEAANANKERLLPVAIMAFRDQSPNDPSSFPTRETLDKNGNPVREQGKEAKGIGWKASSLLFAELVVDPALYLVEREEIDKAIEELELSVAGIVSPATANRVGQMTGAKILLAGTVMIIDSSMYVVVKIIGTESTRVLGASAKGPATQGPEPLIEKVAKEISKIITERNADLVPKEIKDEDRIAEIRKKTKLQALPTISINIHEQHVGLRVPDPAASTELAMIFRELGFTVLDDQKGDVILSGEGISEMGIRKKGLVSVKARLEVKATDAATKKILVTERQTKIAIELGEQISGKDALQAAAMDIAERLIPKMLEARSR